MCADGNDNHERRGAMNWTARMIETLTADAEYYWAENAAYRTDFGKDSPTYLAAYNRRMFAVAYLRTRLDG